MISSAHFSKKAAAAYFCRRSFSMRPWLMLPPSNGYNYFSSVGEEKVVRVKQNGGDDGGGALVGASRGWVALYKERERLLSLSNPITGEHMKLPSPPGRGFCVDKLILTSSRDGEWRAAMLFDNGDLTFCAPGRPSSAWTAPVSTIPYFDFVYSRRNAQLLCLVETEDPEMNSLEAWDLSDPCCPRIVWSERLRDFEPHYPDLISSRYRRHFVYINQRKYLSYVEPIFQHSCSEREYLAYVEPTDELLLVTRYYIDQMAPDGISWADENHIYPRKTMGFQVQVIDRRSRKLRYMDGSLGGLALFVGRNETLAVATAYFRGLQPDSIYFTDSGPCAGIGTNDLHDGHDIGIFDYKKGMITSCYYSCHYNNFTKIHPAPLWFTPAPQFDT